MLQDEYARKKIRELEARLEIMNLDKQFAERKKTKLTFGDALEWMKQGKRVSRWHLDEICICLERPLVTNSVTLPYIKVRTINNDVTVWCPNHGDLLAENWRVVENGLEETV